MRRRRKEGEEETRDRKEKKDVLQPKKLDWHQQWEKAGGGAWLV